MSDCMGGRGWLRCRYFVFWAAVVLSAYRCSPDRTAGATYAFGVDNLYIRSLPLRMGRSLQGTQLLKPSAPKVYEYVGGPRALLWPYP